MTDFYEEHGIEIWSACTHPNAREMLVFYYKGYLFVTGSLMDTGIVPGLPHPPTRKSIEEMSDDFYKVYAELLDLFTDEVFRSMSNSLIKAGYLVHNIVPPDYINLTNKDILNLLDNYYLPDSLNGSILNNCEWVYLVGNKNEGKYKIGMTTRTPTQRINVFSPNLPFETEILAQCPTTNAYKLENKLHAMFADKRTNGEWFELSDGDVIYIRSMSI